jgi:hypothetical protein
MSKKMIGFFLFLALFAGIMVSAPGCLPSPYSVGSADSLFSGFSLAWYLADHNYSSFVVHQDVNWDQVFSERRDAGLALSDWEELFDLTCDMFSTLSDGQIYFYRDSTFFPTYDSGRFANFDRGVWEDYMTGWGAQVHSSLTTALTGPDGTIAYVFFGSNPGLTGGHVYLSFFWATGGMEDCSAMILDLRGGYSCWPFYDALQCSGRFMDKPYPALYRQYRNGFGRLEMEDPELVSTFRQGAWQFTKPVVVLTGSNTSGFLEVLAMLMSPPEHVVLMGDRTAGAPDISRPFRLCNPMNIEEIWYLYLPGMVIYDLAMNPVAGMGLEPDIAVTVSPGDFAAGVDPVLEAAVEYLSR